jgi:hypothetical protein
MIICREADDAVRYVFKTVLVLKTVLLFSSVSEVVGRSHQPIDISDSALPMPAKDSHFAAWADDRAVLASTPASLSEPPPPLLP